MTEWIWLNGDVLPLADARISVEDRGFLFADGVYEVVRCYNGRPFCLQEHLDRLDRSCSGISLQVPMPRAHLASKITELVRKSAMADGMIYLQLTRGVAPRNHLFPNVVKPTLMFFVRALPPVPPAGQAAGVKLISVEDERWKRCWIKSIALLPNVLAKNAVTAAGADEGVFIDAGVVSECCASNFFAIINRQLITAPVGAKVLPGITRLVVMNVARRLGINVVERPLTASEAADADELFITSTTREIGWAAQWDGQSIGNGACGPVTLELHKAYQQEVASACG